ncbi:MAG: hypothetical protein E7Z97_03970 [Propionibacteriaceae bacterium]|nr:hypothetical protein [Propionibacteriaceae bacterium]
MMTDHGILQSVGRIGSCFDNAAAESFNAILKNELVNRKVYPTRQYAAQDVTAWIEYDSIANASTRPSITRLPTKSIPNGGNTSRQQPKPTINHCPKNLYHSRVLHNPPGSSLLNVKLSTAAPSPRWQGPQFITGWGKRKHPFVWTKPSTESTGKVSMPQLQDTLGSCSPARLCSLATTDPVRPTTSGTVPARQGDSDDLSPNPSSRPARPARHRPGPCHRLRTQRQYRDGH